MTTATETQSNILKNISYAAGTDVGMRREENQDSFGVIENDHFRMFVVADGMGGVKGGAVASSTAVEVLRNCLQNRSRISEQDIVAAVINANTEVFEKGEEDRDLEGMGTTLVALVFVGMHMYVVNVGDSRAYLIRKGKIRQLTEDHTLVQELLRSGAISADQAEDHPVAHMLTRSLGPTPNIDVDCFLYADGPARGDIFVLCSDGLYNMVSDREIKEIVENHSLDDATQELIKLANQRGGTDNITLILISIGEGFPTDPSEFEDWQQEGEETLEIDVSEEEIQQITEDSDSEAETINGTNGHTTEQDVRITGNSFGTFQEDLGQASTATSENISDQVDEVSTAHEEPSTVASEPQETPSLSQSRFWLGAVVALIAAGYLGYLGGSFYTNRNVNTARVIVKEAGSESDIVAVPVVKRPVVVSYDPLPPPELNKKPHIALPDIVNFDIKSSVKEMPDVNADMYNGLSREEVINISARKQKLRSYIKELDKKIAQFDKPISGEISELLAEARKRMAELRNEREQVLADIDKANRKIQVWYGRLKRFENGEAVNVASEVAVSSDSVREKREIFQNASYDYLREAEVLRYNPNDSAQEQKVARLARLRRQRMRELLDDTLDEIHKVIGDSNKKIAESTLRRDRIEAELTALKKDIEFAQVLLNGDSKARNKKKSELIHEKQISEVELKELEDLLPLEEEIKSAG
ncbi:MAG: Stp1/IreP family PP2C-type Ser/Thr phosphatase [Candidatus Dadabacteria bacterium]|nr:MAG: Stp1/IreP family PP2C-type Ser/Thr phosphatase [Candidatus Dadabacteria bacterium]